jgi:AraC-like DNA-binding protein
MPGYLAISKIPPFFIGDRNYPSPMDCNSLNYNSCCNNFNPGTNRETFNLKNRQFSFYLILRSEDKGILRYQMGEKNLSFLMNSYMRIVKRELSNFDAQYIEWNKDLLLACFLSAPKAICCAMVLKNSLKGFAESMILKIALKVGGNFKINYDELRTDYIFFYKIKETKPKIEQKVLRLQQDENQQISLLIKVADVLEIAEQKFLIRLFKNIRENWQNPYFNVANLCQKMSTSNSGLYRKCTKITGISPIKLVKEYRLLKCLKTLRSRRSIKEILYDSGFNSPSYFSRCFKDRFGFSPHFYQKNLV